MNPLCLTKAQDFWLQVSLQPQYLCVNVSTTAGLNNNLSLLTILHSLHPQQHLNRYWLFTWRGEPMSGPSIILLRVTYWGIPLTLGKTKRCPRESPTLQTESSLPPLWKGSPLLPWQCGSITPANIITFLSLLTQGHQDPSVAKGKSYLPVQWNVYCVSWKKHFPL